MGPIRIEDELRPGSSVDAAPASKPHPRYFERPDPGQRPLSLWETIAVVLSSHIGVRTRKQREEDFRRANGLHLFVAGIAYFLLIIGGLVALVNYIAA